MNVEKRQDILSLYNTHFYISPQVDPMPIADFRNILIGLTTTTDDLADIIDAIANLDETSSYANAMQDMLHVMSQNDEFAGKT